MFKDILNNTIYLRQHNQFKSYGNVNGQIAKAGFFIVVEFHRVGSTINRATPSSLYTKLGEEEDIINILKQFSNKTACPMLLYSDKRKAGNNILNTKSKRFQLFFNACNRLTTVAWNNCHKAIIIRTPLLVPCMLRNQLKADLLHVFQIAFPMSLNICH